MLNLPHGPYQFITLTHSRETTLTIVLANFFLACSGIPDVDSTRDCVLVCVVLCRSCFCAQGHI